MTEQLPAVIERIESRELALRGHPAGPPPVPAIDYLRRAMGALRRRWLPFLAAILVVMGLATVYMLNKTPQFRSTATLLVNARVLNVQAKDNDIVPVGTAEDKAVNSEIEVVQSSDVARRVITAMNAQRADYGRIVTQSKTPPSERAVLDSTQGRLRVDRPGGTNVLALTFTAADPAVAAATANEFARQYLAFKIDNRLDAARLANRALTGELDTLRARVVDAEAAVAQFRRSHNLLSANGETLTEQEQSVYKQQEAAAQTQLAEERARLSTARSQLSRGSSGDDVGEALSSPVVNQLRSQRALASARLAQLEARYKPAHPEVVRATQELHDVDMEIQGEIGRVMSNLEAKVQVAQQRAGAASGIAGASRGELALNTAASVQLNELERRAEAFRTNYNTLLQRQTAVASQAVVADVDARQLSQALVPDRPSTPNRKLDLLLSLVVALLMASGIVAVLQLLDQTITSSRQAEDVLGIRHVVNVPSMKSIAERAEQSVPPIDYVLQYPLSPLGEAMRSLLLAIERGKRRDGVVVVGITSAQAEEGKSTTAACLARVAAISGRRTLLIDGDIRRPSVAAMFGLTPHVGLTEVLAEQVSFREALLRDERSGAYILPSVVQPYEHRHLNSETNLRLLMSRLGEVFDLVVVDTAPSLAAVESRLLMNFVDQAYLAVRWKHTRVPLVRAALKRLFAIGIRVSGVIMTQVNMRSIAAYAVDDVDHGYVNYGYTTT